MHLQGGQSKLLGSNIFESYSSNIEQISYLYTSIYIHGKIIKNNDIYFKSNEIDGIGISNDFGLMNLPFFPLIN